MKLCLFNGAERGAAIVGCSERQFRRLMDAVEAEPISFAGSKEDRLYKYRAEDVLKAKALFRSERKRASRGAYST